MLNVPSAVSNASGVWRSAARHRLIEQRAAPGWSYRAGGPACAEPTVLASLALFDDRQSSEAVSTLLAQASRWLADQQAPDGSVPNSGGAVGPWATPYAILLWNALGTHRHPCERAVAWLLARRGRSFARDPNSPVGHDTSLVGWPWIEDTHSWVEPTALAVLALCREGLQSHARTQEGVRLILDRAIRSGGWNYGNNVVFGRELRPRPAPTGIALVALAASRSKHPAVDRACRYLEQELPAIRSAQSLCWGLLGLSAWARRPAEADRWLAEAYQRAQRRREGPCQTAYLLFAAGKHSLAALGIQEKGPS
jgi:hypothetical protein